MIRVHVWPPDATSKMGHASMHVGRTYISWWPQGRDRKYYLPTDSVPLYSVSHIDQRSYADDVEAEEKEPAHTIHLQGLDEARVLDWWEEYNDLKAEWTTLGKNCSTTVGRGLMSGGGDDYALGLKGWFYSWNMVWTPDNVLKYATAIHRGLKKKGDKRSAINFIRRFCDSPLGLTSVAWNMDEEGLAKAIYQELGPETVKVRQVFEELDQRRNADADDVAQIYVQLLSSRKGAVLEMVKTDGPLKQLLIKILNEGWTSPDEQKCIDFLRSLK
jgi:hypothetical protein